MVKRIIVYVKRSEQMLRAKVEEKVGENEDVVNGGVDLWG